MPSKLPTVSATGGSVASEAPWVSSMKREDKRKVLNYSGFPSTPNSGNGFGAPQRRIRAGTRRKMSGKRTDDQMKSLDEQMAIYAAYHRNQWNKLTHFVGVPAIVFAILIPMSWVPLGAGVTLAHVFLGVVLAYYLLLDFPLGLATGVMSFALLYTAELAAGTSVASGWIWFGAFFVGGRMFQIARLAFQGRSPGLAGQRIPIVSSTTVLGGQEFVALRM